MGVRLTAMTSVVPSMAGAATAGAASFDGLHYGMDVNLLKAQLIMNFLSLG